MRNKVADDIALIQLDQEAEWNDLVQPTCLPNPDRDSYSGMMATVAGWGLTNEIENGKSFICFNFDKQKKIEQKKDLKYIFFLFFWDCGGLKIF